MAKEFLCPDCSFAKIHPTDGTFKCEHPDRKREGAYSGLFWFGMDETPTDCTIREGKWLPEGPEKSEFKVIIISRCLDCGYCKEGVAGGLYCEHPDVIQLKKEKWKDWEPKRYASLCEMLGDVDPEKEIYAGCPLMDLRRLTDEMP